MFTSEFNERSRSNPLCDFRLGTVATSDHETPLTQDEVVPRDRQGRPDIDSQEGAWPQHFVIENDEAELELSVESRSFVNRVNDQVRRRQKRISSVTGNGEKHSMIWRMFVAVTMQSAVFMGKNYQNNRNFSVNTADLILKQMFDISAKLVSEQDEISGMETIGWENHSWKYMSLIGDERVINLQRTKVYVFSDSVLCLGKIFENTQSNDAWEERLGLFKSSQVYKNFDRIDGEPMEFEWHISKDSIRCSSVKKSKSYCRDQMKHQRISQEGLSSCRCSTPSLVDQETMKKNASQMPISFLYMQKDLEQDNGHLLVLVLKRSGILSVKIVHKKSGTKWRKDDVGIRRKRTSNFPCCKSIVQRSTQKQRPWKIVDNTLLCRFGND